MILSATKQTHFAAQSNHHVVFIRHSRNSHCQANSVYLHRFSCHRKIVVITLSADGTVFASFGFGSSFIVWLLFGVRNLLVGPSLINSYESTQKFGYSVLIQCQTVGLSMPIPKYSYKILWTRSVCTSKVSNISLSFTLYHPPKRSFSFSNVSIVVISWGVDTLYG